MPFVLSPLDQGNKTGSMKVLVTGTAGFIGFHLARTLLDQGHQVLGLDNFNGYYAPVLKRRRHALLEGRPGYQGHEADITDYAFMRELAAREKPDVFCHLAAQAGVRHSLSKPFDYQRSNLDAFLNVLETCRHEAIPRLVYASSSSVYGNSQKLPFNEEDRVDNPISLYAATKKANELMAHTYSHLYGFQTVGLRFFTVYGPWGRPDMALWLFADAITRGRPINVFNHGQLQRDFTYVDDIVAGVIASLPAPGLDRYEIINLGNNRPETLMDMIQEMGRQMGTEPKLNLLPMQPGDVLATYADTAKAARKLGFAPKTPLHEGMGHFLDWFRSVPELVESVAQGKG